MKTIRRPAGAASYVGGIVRDTTGQDLSVTTFQVSFGTRTDPGATWYDPDINEAGDTPSTRHISYLVTATTPDALPAGDYYVWIKVEDLPEVELLRVPEIIRVV